MRRTLDAAADTARAVQLRLTVPPRLASGGTVVISPHHPLGDFEMSPSGDCFRVESLRGEWLGFEPPTRSSGHPPQPLGRRYARRRARLQELA